jgi:hypothetical protein
MTKKLYEQIKTYLTERWLISNFETQIKEIAHNVRNVKITKRKNSTRQNNFTIKRLINLLGIFTTRSIHKMHNESPKNLNCKKSRAYNY